MIKAMVTGISQALDARFGKPVYSEEPVEGSERPYFFVKLVESKENPYSGKRYIRKQTFDIEYVPATGLEPNSERYGVLETLYDCLEYIDIGDEQVKGKDMHQEVKDDFLHFIVSYDLVLVKQSPPDEPMAKISIAYEREEVV